MKEKICKITGCSKPRFNVLSVCYAHFRERERERKEASRAKKLARKLGSKTFQLGEKKKWHAKCWKLMSQWVRRKEADFNGYVRCYTCDKALPWRETDASHRYHRKLDFDERNIRPCCIKCNKYLHGNLGEYERRIIRDHGIAYADQLMHDATRHSGYSLPELKEIHASLTEKLAKL